MTIWETLTEGKRLLKDSLFLSSINTPDLDAALLLAEVLHTSREALIAGENEIVTEADRARFLELLERRRSGECVAYILGYREFRGLRFWVNPSVLVPRPDTEILVETILEYIDSLIKQEKLSRNISLLEIGTGSGAVAVSLKNERPFICVTATDISKEALEIAIINSGRLQENSIRFIESDLFENIREKFDIIVSNPPYVPEGELASLAPEVKREPVLALDGGEDGLDIIKKIIFQSPDYLYPRGVFLLEAGPDQMQKIRALLIDRGFGNIKVTKDLAGRERVISAILEAK